MKVAIISDIHDNHVNLNKCLAWCENNNIEELICCGDVTNIDTIDKMAKDFSGTIHLVKGNVCLFEEHELEKYDNLIYYGSIGRFKLDKYLVGLCHEPFLFNKVKKLGACDYIFYGHTHKPWIEEKNGIQLINPGALGGMLEKATFTHWDTSKNKIELKILEKINLA